MELRYAFDPARWCLGKLCPHSHEWPGTGQSLRRSEPGVYGCAGCTGRKQSHWLVSFIDYKSMEWPDSHRLGKVCIGEHQWNCSGLTLRINNRCVACDKLSAKTRGQKRKNKIKQSPILSEARRQWHRAYYRSNPSVALYHREKKHRRKAQERGQTPLQVPVTALRQRFNEFGHRCAYCGQESDLQIEHVQPISKGGAHDIGNIVPACFSCNNNKRTSEMESWYRRQPFFSELRLQSIRRMVRAPEGAQLAIALA